MPSASQNMDPSPPPPVVWFVTGIVNACIKKQLSCVPVGGYLKMFPNHSTLTFTNRIPFKSLWHLNICVVLCNKSYSQTVAFKFYGFPNPLSTTAKPTRVNRMSHALSLPVPTVTSEQIDHSLQDDMHSLWGFILKCYFVPCIILKAQCSF